MSSEKNFIVILLNKISLICIIGINDRNVNTKTRRVGLFSVMQLKFEMILTYNKIAMAN
jgi:hypothetical protein